MTSHTRSARRILGILKKSVSWVESCLGRRQLTFACSRRLCALRALHEMVGCRLQSQNRKNVYLSPYVEEPSNSNVIKSFVPELRSRKCFCVSRFLCSMYICYDHYMSISHIAVSGYGTLLQCHCVARWSLHFRKPLDILVFKTLILLLNKNYLFN